MRDIFVYNTLSGKKEKLETLEPQHVKMYACGVTVYDDCHIGHAMQAIYFDVIRNYLEYAGYKVTYVRNYTDVDDKIINRAKERGLSPLELAQQMIAASEIDMKSIGVRAADFEPRVSEAIPAIIAMTQELITRGFAYATPQGDVYYRVHKKADYGKLSNRRINELRGGTRDLVQGEKDDALDFALWKQDRTKDASWESPWGLGRPGWHIECSAMAKAHLGPSFDIHGGGRDLVFPHHENEIAQSEAANGCAYARYWLHSGLLTIDKRKMSKSLGNHILIQQFVERFPGEVLRLAYLQSHYTSNVDFSEDVFRVAAQRLLYFYESLLSLDNLSATAPEVDKTLPSHAPIDLIEKFHEQMSQDFSSVGALREITLCFRKANELKVGKASTSKSYTAKLYAKTIREVCKVLGILQMKPEIFISQLKLQILKEMQISLPQVEALIEARKAARESKNFVEADTIRQNLTQLGIELMDTPESTRWTVLWKDEDK